jgi:hypothetical protein
LLFLGLRAALADSVRRCASAGAAQQGNLART